MIEVKAKFFHNKQVYAFDGCVYLAAHTLFAE